MGATQKAIQLSGAKKPSPAFLTSFNRQKVVAGEGVGEGEVHSQISSITLICPSGIFSRSHLYVSNNVDKAGEDYSCHREKRESILIKSPVVVVMMYY